MLLGKCSGLNTRELGPLIKRPIRAIYPVAGYESKPCMSPREAYMVLTLRAGQTDK